MGLQTIKNLKAEKGFTIVELLIVIVVIGILAAITIVAYNGVQNKAKATQAQSAANSVIKKAELYNADESTSGYPTTFAQLDGATSDKVFALDGVTLVPTTAMTAAPTPSSSVNFYTCGASVGNKVGYWDFGASPAVLKFMYSGSATSATACGTPTAT